jgi:hypothetical protein
VCGLSLDINYCVNAGDLDEESHEDGWIIIAYSSAAASFAVIIMIILVVLCCLCRRCHQKKTSKNLMKSLRPSVTYKKPDHFYDEIDIHPKPELLGMKKNEAYYSTVH